MTSSMLIFWVNFSILFHINPNIFKFTLTMYMLLSMKQTQNNTLKIKYIYSHQCETFNMI